MPIEPPPGPPPRPNQSSLSDRLQRLDSWPTIQLHVSRWIALFTKVTTPACDTEQRLLSIMIGDVPPRDDCPIEAAAADFGFIASVERGPRYEVYTERERWYPESAHREGIYAPRRGGSWMYFNDVR
jgi:hypothetical protein